MGQDGDWYETVAPPNRFLYNGKELTEDLDLNWLDYGARWYDPAIGRWNAVDALADDPTQIDKSVYAYAWNNPISLTDPDGNCPDCPDEVYVDLADHVYGAKVGSSVNGWTVIEGGVRDNPLTGFKGAVYQGSGEYEGQYIFATAGTQGLMDAIQDYTQLGGEAGQYTESVSNAENLSEEYPGISFTGHSLGGGLASANALATEGKAVTFNAAGLSGLTKSRLNLNSKSANITAYTVSGEILDKLQKNVGLRAEANTRVLLPSIGKNSIDKHLMSNVREAFNLYQEILSKPHRTFNYNRQ